MSPQDKAREMFGMSPQDKAEVLFDMMYNVEDPMCEYPMCFYTAKQCALIAVDEILELDDFSVEGREYWQQVKTEIEKL